MTLVQVVDTLTQRSLAHADSVSRALDAKYVDLLQRTNAQLGLGWTHVGAVFTILAVLVALLSIGGALVVYFQSREYRVQLEEMTKNFKELFDADAQRNKAVIEGLAAVNTATMDQLTARADSLREQYETASDSEKHRLEEKIAAIEEEQRRFKSDSESIVRSLEEVVNPSIERYLRKGGIGPPGLHPKIAAAMGYIPPEAAVGNRVAAAMRSITKTGDDDPPDKSRTP
jgi:Na+-transporting methylmalonyl-CoA/oxaloacetate decarboxylase gamma subunit